MDRFASSRDTGRVRERKVALIHQLLGGRDGNFSGCWLLVILERGVLQIARLFFMIGGRHGSGRERHGMLAAIIPAHDAAARLAL